MSDSKDSSNQSPAFGESAGGSYTVRYNNHRSFWNGYDDYIQVTPGDWLRIYLEMWPSSQVFTMTEDNMTTGEKGPDLDCIYCVPLQGVPLFNPTTWDQINIGWRFNTAAVFDNITISSPVPEPASCCLLMIGVVPIVGRKLFSR